MEYTMFAICRIRCLCKINASPARALRRSQQRPVHQAVLCPREELSVEKPEVKRLAGGGRDYAAFSFPCSRFKSRGTESSVDQIRDKRTRSTRSLVGLLSWCFPNKLDSGTCKSFFFKYKCIIINISYYNICII